MTKLLDRFGLTNLATVQQKLADRGSQFLASQAIIIGQTTFEVIIKLFIMRRDVPRRQPSAVRCLVGFLSELHALKIDLFLRQQGLDTTTPAGKAMFQMMGVFAEFERAMIQERVRAGLARARSEGKRLGRPPIAPALEKRIREALATPGRPGIRVIAKQFGVSPMTVQNVARA